MNDTGLDADCYDDSAWGDNDYDWEMTPRPDDLPRFKVGDTCIVNPDKRDMWHHILHHPDRLFVIRAIVWQDEGGWDILELDQKNDPETAKVIGQEWLSCNESYMVLAGHVTPLTSDIESPVRLTRSRVQETAAIVTFHGRKFR